MSDKLYSIKESTLVDIGDALRRKYGETESVLSDQPFEMQISKSKNATGFGEFSSGTYINGAANYQTTITGASKLKVKLSFNLTNINGNDQYIQIAAGTYKNAFPNDIEYIELLPADNGEYKEYEFDGDSITIRHNSILSDGPYGFYAEIYGYKEVEVKKTYKSSEVAQAIDAIEVGGVLPEEAFVLAGDCSYKFNNGAWDWFLDMYSSKITTKNIGGGAYMFYFSTIKNMPFDINCSNSSYNNYNNMFQHCYYLKNIGKITNMYPSSMAYIFHNCYELRYLPEFVNLNTSRLNTYAYSNMGSMFYGCYSLREIPEDFLKQFYGIYTSQSYSPFNSAFTYCYCLDEIKGLNPQSGALSSNVFSTSFQYCYRLKNVIFAMQDDGSPYTVNWKNQTIDLSSYDIGCANPSGIKNITTRYNGGITADKEVTDDATYQALKNDPDWFTSDVAYSRYNHDSAVNTINSLPDTSAYGTNTIKFKGVAGEKTDGGAINTLTEEEIAVATAKGWTISFV